MSAIGISHFHVIRRNTVYSNMCLASITNTTSFSFAFPQSKVPVPIPLLLIAPYFSKYMWSHSHTSYSIPPPQLVMNAKFSYKPTIAVITPACSIYSSIHQTRMLLLQAGFKKLSLTAEEWALYVRNFSLTAEEWVLCFKKLNITSGEWALYVKNLNLTAEEWACTSRI